MQSTIFTINFPPIKTIEELDSIKRKNPKLDPYFIACSNHQNIRRKLDELWQRYKPYSDRHFLIQIRTNFHQRWWEMYVGNVFLEKGLTIQSKTKSEGPDFIVKDVAYIECVAPTKGDPTKTDSVPKMFIARTYEDIRVQDVPIDKMIFRISSVIKDKALFQYEKWKTKKWFNNKMPFIITVNTGDLEHVEDPNMPNILKTLFGFQFLQINTKTGSTSFSHRDNVKKSNKEPVSVNYFVNRDFSFISGVLFSSNLAENYLENIGEDCYFVNNPFADNPVNDSFIRLFKSWVATKENGIINIRRNF